MPFIFNLKGASPLCGNNSFIAPNATLCADVTQSKLDFWNSVLQAIEVISFDEVCVNTAVDVNAALKRKRKQTGIADFFIAATALAHNLPIATINKNHFNRIDGLEIIDIE